LKTTNGGINWIISQPIGNYSYRDVFFLNFSTGWIVGNRYFTGGMYWGTEKVIVKTINGGINWTITHTINSIYQGTGFMSIYFIDAQTGWVATRYNGILKSTNGGINWFTDYTPFDDGYNTIFFIDNETGWIAGGRNNIGYGGTVLTTGNFPIGIKKTYTNSSVYFSLSQNYPNPFNPVTMIKYDVPAVGQRHAFDLRLIIYDILGREIETLVNESQKPGSYEVTWDGSRFASGVYFYRLYIDDASAPLSITKKMVLIK
jgi:hypothetical protein